MSRLFSMRQRDRVIHGKHELAILHQLFDARSVAQIRRRHAVGLVWPNGIWEMRAGLGIILHHEALSLRLWAVWRGSGWLGCGLSPTSLRLKCRPGRWQESAGKRIAKPTKTFDSLPAQSGSEDERQRLLESSDGTQTDSSRFHFCVCRISPVFGAGVPRTLLPE